MSLVSNSISMVSESKSVDDIEKALFLLYSKEEVRRHGEDMVEKYASKGDKDSVLFFYSRMDERYTVRDLSVYINDAALAYVKNKINNVGEENLPSYVVEYLSKIKSEEFALGKIKDCLPIKFISKVEESINEIADEIKKEGDFYVTIDNRKIKFKDYMKEIEILYGNDKKNIRDERKYVLDYYKKYISWRPQKLSATPDHFGKVLPHVLSRTQRHRARHDPDRPVQWLQPAQACPADEPQPLDGQP